MATEWEKWGTAAWATDGTNRKIQPYIRCKQTLNTKTQASFSVYSCARDGDGHYYHNYDYGFELELWYRTSKDISGNNWYGWVKLKDTYDTTKGTNTSDNPGVIVGELTYNKTFNRSENTEGYLLEFQTYIPKRNFNETSATVRILVNPKTKYTITYYPNEGSVTSSWAETKWHDKTLPITTKSPGTKLGYHFLNKWTTNQDGSGTAYTTEITTNSDLGLYAQFAPNNYTIKYEYNHPLGSYQASEEQTATYGQNWETIPGYVPRDGFLFNEWNTASDGTGISYSAGQSQGLYEDTTDLTLYAQWIPAIYTINYELNGGYWEWGLSEDKEYNVPLALMHVPEKTGYTFEHWVDSDGDIYTVSNESQYIKNKSTTLSAQWIRIQKRVFYTGQKPQDAPENIDIDWTDIPNNVLHNYGDPWSTIDKTPSLLYYKFKEWNSKADGTGKSYTKNQKNILPAITEDITLYAQWERLKYTVSYDGNGGSVDPSFTTTYQGIPITLATTSSHTISPGSKRNTYSVEFHATEGVFTDQTSIFTASVFNTTTYEFDGTWLNRDQSGTITIYNAGDQYDKYQDITLSAQWIEYPPTEYPTLMNLPTLAPRDNYEFTGWYSSTSYNDYSYKVIEPDAENYQLEDKYINKRNNTEYLYAHWIPTTYILQYNKNTVTYSVDNMPNSVEVSISPGTTILSLNKPKIKLSSTATVTPYSITYDYQDGTSERENDIQENIPFEYWLYGNDPDNDPHYFPGDTVTFTVSPGTIINLNAIWGPRIDGATLLEGKHRNGYIFDGWYQSPKYDTIKLEPGNSYASDLLSPERKNIVLYAKWKKIAYNIEYLPNQGTNIEDLPEPQRNWSYGDHLRISSIEPKRRAEQHTFNVSFYIGEELIQENIFNAATSYLFKNWNINDDPLDNNSENIYNKNDIYIAGVFEKGIIQKDETNIDLVLYPQWDSESITSIITLPIIDDPNYSMWDIYEVINNQEIHIGEGQPGEKYQPIVNNNLILRARPIASKNYEITYNFNKGWYIDDQENKIYGPLITTATVGVPSTISNTMLYRDDEINKYTVVIDYNNSNYYKKTDIYNVQPISRYNFIQKWNRNIDGNGTEYNANQQYIENRDISLYAQWEKLNIINYNLQYYISNSDTEEPNNEVEWSEERPENVPENNYLWIRVKNIWSNNQIDYSTPVLEENYNTINRYVILTPPNFCYGYDFKGWYADKNYNKLISTDSIIFIPSDNITIYAKWTTAKYNINYNAGEGNNQSVPTSQTKIYNQDIKLSYTKPIYLDHVFTGWKSNQIEYFGYDQTGFNAPKLVEENRIQLTQEYCLSDSIITPLLQSSDEWSTDKPIQEDNKYIWSRIKIKWPDDNNYYYSTPVCITEYNQLNIIKEYYISSTTVIPNPNDDQWTTESPISTSGIHVWERFYLEWFEIYQPGDIYTRNHSVELIAQWREINTLTEWLSRWEDTEASIIADIPGNELVLWEGDNSIAVENSSNLLKILKLIDDKGTITSSDDVNYNLGLGYKLKLSLINPYNDYDENNNIEQLSRTIFVPARKKINDDIRDKFIWIRINIDYDNTLGIESEYTDPVFIEKIEEFKVTKEYCESNNKPAASSTLWTTIRPEEELSNTVWIRIKVEWPNQETPWYSQITQLTDHQEPFVTYQYYISTSNEDCINGRWTIENPIKYDGYYEIPANVKVSEISLFNEAQATIDYKAHIDLNYIDISMPQAYEAFEEIVGQIDGYWNYNQNITSLLTAKYYAHDNNKEITYEHKLDSWSAMSFEGTPYSRLNISLAGEPNSTVYVADQNGILNLDINYSIDDCTILGRQMFKSNNPNNLRDWEYYEENNWSDNRINNHLYPINNSYKLQYNGSLYDVDYSLNTINVHIPIEGNINYKANIMQRIYV